MSPERELNVTGSGKGLGQWGFLNFPSKLPKNHSLDALSICLSTEPNKEWAAKKYLCKVTEERNRKGRKRRENDSKREGKEGKEGKMGERGGETNNKQTKKLRS